jgi:hypothetical protein
MSSKFSHPLFSKIFFRFKKGNGNKNVSPKLISHGLRSVFIFCLFLFALILIPNCAVNKNPKENIKDRSGLQLWTDNCSRCHNVPGPGEYSDDEWEVIGAHMRVRAYLSEKEADNIIIFLKSIN